MTVYYTSGTIMGYQPLASDRRYHGYHRINSLPDKRCGGLNESNITKDIEAEAAREEKI